LKIQDSSTAAIFLDYSIAAAEEKVTSGKEKRKMREAASSHAIVMHNALPPTDRMVWLPTNRDDFPAWV